MPLNSAGDVVPLTNVNWRLITAQLVLSLWHWKRKRPSTYPYSWATQCKRSLPHAKSNKLPLALKPENKQRVTLKLSGRSFHVLSVSTSSFIRQRCIFYSASLPPFLRVCWISKKWNKTIHNHDKLRIGLWLWDGHKGQHKLPKKGSLT